MYSTFYLIISRLLHHFNSNRCFSLIRHNVLGDGSDHNAERAGAQLLAHSQFISWKFVFIVVRQQFRLLIDRQFRVNSIRMTFLEHVQTGCLHSFELLQTKKVLLGGIRGCSIVHFAFVLPCGLV